jgi:glycosyltransferase involved in cell wall biosynthesis
MHSLYWPRQAVLAWYFARNNIPFLVTPNGGLARQSKRLKKSLYVALVERRRLRAASAITVVDPQEEKAVRADVPDYEGIVRWVPNPVDTRGLEGFSWQENVEAKRLVFLGRFHVVHKGLDILVDIASFLPDVEFHLYGTDDGRASKLLKQLQRRSPPNVYFHGPVFEAEKAKVLTNASLYIQTSRWEGFPLSIVEAMYLGVPCAIANTFFQAELFRWEDLGLVFPPRPEEAAAQLAEALAQPARLRHWSRRSRDFARENFDPRTVASKYLQLYEEVLRARGTHR